MVVSLVVSWVVWKADLLVGRLVALKAVQLVGVRAVQTVVSKAAQSVVLTVDQLVVWEVGQWGRLVLRLVVEAAVW